MKVLKKIDNHLEYDSTLSGMPLNKDKVICCVDERHVHFAHKSEFEYPEPEENCIDFYYLYAKTGNVLRINNFQAANYLTPYFQSSEIFDNGLTPRGNQPYANYDVTKDGIYKIRVHLKNNNNSVKSHMFRQDSYGSYTYFRPYNVIVIPKDITRLEDCCFRLSVNNENTPVYRVNKIVCYSNNIYIGSTITLNTNLQIYLPNGFNTENWTTNGFSNITFF